MDEIILNIGLLTVKGIYIFLVLIICELIFNDFTISVGTTVLVTFLILLYNPIERFIMKSIKRS